MAKIMDKTRDWLESELEKVYTTMGGGNEMKPSTLDVVDKLTHAIKSIDTITAMEHSNSYGRDNYGGHENYGRGNYRGGYNDDGYRDDRYGRDNYGRRERDSRGRYRDNGEDKAEMMEELERKMRSASGSERKAFEECLQMLRDM